MKMSRKAVNITGHITGCFILYLSLYRNSGHISGAPDSPLPYHLGSTDYYYSCVLPSSMQPISSVCSTVGICAISAVLPSHDISLKCLDTVKYVINTCRKHLITQNKSQNPKPYSVRWQWERRRQPLGNLTQFT